MSDRYGIVVIHSEGREYRRSDLRAARKGGRYAATDRGTTATVYAPTEAGRTATEARNEAQRDGAT